MILFLSFLLVVTGDQLSKNIWVRSYREGQTIYELGFFRLAHIQNTGVAFGMFQGQSSALTIAAGVGIVVLVGLAFVIYRRFPFLVSLPNTVAFSLILGGTVGNLIDRLRLDHVTDFIDVGVWPAFNVADSAIVVGVVIVAYSLIRLAVAERHGSA